MKEEKGIRALEGHEARSFFCQLYGRVKYHETFLVLDGIRLVVKGFKAFFRRILLWKKGWRYKVKEFSEREISQ